MAKIDLASYDIGYLEVLANMDTPVHRLDPRAKVLTTLVFIILVTSFGKYEVSRLLPFFIFPVVFFALGNLPIIYILKKILIVSPFILFVGIFNPLLDQEILLRIGPYPISGGWISFISILLRFTLTMGAALILIATTGFPAVCMALEKLGTPNIFVVQLLFLYRYIFLLFDEGIRMVRAYTLRSIGGKGMRLRLFYQFTGNLLLRTFDRAQRIHMAMLCRGFQGEIRVTRQDRFGVFEIVYTLGSCAVLIFMRFYDIPKPLGDFFIQIIP